MVVGMNQLPPKQKQNSPSSVSLFSFSLLSGLTHKETLSSHFLNSFQTLSSLSSSSIILWNDREFQNSKIFSSIKLFVIGYTLESLESPSVQIFFSIIHSYYLFYNIIYYHYGFIFFTRFYVWSMYTCRSKWLRKNLLTYPIRALCRCVGVEMSACFRHTKSRRAYVSMSGRGLEVIDMDRRKKEKLCYESFVFCRPSWECGCCGCCGCCLRRRLWFVLCNRLNQPPYPWPRYLFFSSVSLASASCSPGRGGRSFSVYMSL